MENDKKKGVEIIIRGDRMGTTFVSLIAQTMYIESINCIPLFPLKTKRFNDPGIFLKICKKLTKINDGSYEMDVELDSKIKSLMGGSRPIYALEKIKQDLVSYFKENYYKRFHNELIKDTKNLKLPWKNNKNIICIHLRLDDRENENDYDGRKSSVYINDLIETNRCKEYNRKSLLRMGEDTQVPISAFNLEHLLVRLKESYPDKELHIVKKGSIEKYNDLINKYNIQVHENDKDTDLWLLINSEILVTSKSFFSQVAMYFHTGSKIYVPYWGSAAASGFMSKYNKTNVEFYL